MKNKNNIITSTLFIIILTLQIIAIIYAVSKREYYHMDEYYSYGLMQYKQAFIFESDDFINNWHTSDYFKDYIRITEENKWDFSAVYKNQIEDVHPPLWYLLLRIANTFNVGNFSIWPGTILNIILFILSSIMIYLIGNKIFKNQWYSLLLCLVSGFSIASIETVMFVRMYQLLVLNILLLTYWHLTKSDKNTLVFKNDLISLYLIFVAGFLTHYYFAIFAGIFLLMYLIKYIKSKSYKNIISYILTIIAGYITTLIIFPYSIQHMFFSYRGRGVLNSLKHSYNVFIYLKSYLNIINEHFFNGHMYIILILIGILILINVILKYYKKTRLQINNKILYIIIPAIIYMLLVSITVPYIDLRYIVPAVNLVLMFVLYLLEYTLSNILNKKKTIFILLCIFCIIFSLTSIPKLSNNLYTNLGYNNLVTYMNEIISDRPILFIYENLDAQYSRLMSIYPVTLTVAKQSYILPDDEVSSEKIKAILNNTNISTGIVLVLDTKNEDAFLHEILNTGLFKEQFKYLTFNLYTVYLLR